jgi:hypothetical protein
LINTQKSYAHEHSPICRPGCAQVFGLFSKSPIPWARVLYKLLDFCPDGMAKWSSRRPTEQKIPWARALFLILDFYGFRPHEILGNCGTAKIGHCFRFFRCRKLFHQNKDQLWASQLLCLLICRRYDGRVFIIAKIGIKSIA